MPSRPGVRIADRGPGWSYAPDRRPPSVTGAHQPGIVTPSLDHLLLAALDLASAVFAIPPGARPGGFLADGRFERR